MYIGKPFKITGNIFELLTPMSCDTDASRRVSVSVSPKLFRAPNRDLAEYILEALISPLYICYTSMLPTPAPTSPGTTSANLPEERSQPQVVSYPDPPRNVGSAPFFVLSALFDKLQNERKPEKRRKLLDTWFNVCVSESSLDNRPNMPVSTGEKRKAIIYTQY